jgi:molecular chaperone GrpE
MNDNNKPEATEVSEDERAVAEELKGIPEQFLDAGDDDEDEDAEDGTLEEALEELRSDLEKAKQDVLYAKADAQNVRRRAEKDVADARSYAATGFARDVLGVADNLGRAMEALPAEIREDEKLKGFVAGMAATQRELDKVLGQHGITRIASMGLPLDPNQHQAMMEIPSADHEPGTIVQEMQSGYMIKDRLLRPAMVGVAKKPD